MKLMRKSALALAVAAFTLTACDTGVLDVDDAALRDAPGLSSVVATEVCQTIDFEQFAHGDLVTTVPSGFGFDLSVTVIPGGEQSLAEARVFDVNYVGNTNDPDLQASEECGACAPYGSVLIIQQKPGYLPAPFGDMVPDDSRDGGDVELSGFSAGTGDYYLKSFVAIDDDTGEPQFQAFADGTPLEPASSALGNGTVEVLAITTEHTISETLSFEYLASGAVDDLEICTVEERGAEGCTPGYWKQEQHFDSYPEGLGAESTTFGDLFSACSSWDFNAQKPESGNICDMTLVEALSLGGGGANALARHATAAYLNAASGMVAYHYTTGEIVNMVNAAIESGEYEGAKNDLAYWNEETPCPLN
jgi:hypothetical protein